MDEVNKKEYELAFLLDSADSETVLSDLLKQFEAEVAVKNPIVEVRLAYPIKKYQTAHFGNYQIKVAPEKIAELKNSLGLSAKIVRFLLITLPKKRAILPAAGIVEYSEKSEKMSSAAAPAVRPQPAPTIVSNEDLEKKLEEILK